MLKELKEKVLAANYELKKRNLVIYTWGNASGIDREQGLVVIKPSGVEYDQLSIDKMVVVDLEGKIVEGDLRPSSDMATHLELYRSFPELGGVVHTHSPWATSWAQAQRSIPCLGTTHADHFYQEIPCTRNMTRKEIEDNYELNTGKVIVETFQNKDYRYTPGVLVACHGPFTWGKDVEEAVFNSVVLEEIAKIAYHTLLINRSIEQISDFLLNKHFWRKNGEKAYYGQETMIK